MISPFILSVAKCSVVFHYSQLYFAGFISDIMPPLCLLTATNAEWDGTFRCTYHIYIVYLLDSCFTSCCFSSPCLIFSWCKEWMLSEIERQKISSSSPHAVLLCRPERCLMKVNVFTRNMYASAKCLWNRVADSTRNFEYLLSVAIEPAIHHSDRKGKKQINMLARWDDSEISLAYMQPVLFF